jgi:GAF domain-containing protein
VEQESADHPALVPEELSRRLREVAQHVQAGDSLDPALERLTWLATEVVGACDVASVSLLDRGRIVTRAATHPDAVQYDLVQYETGEGPCLETAVGADRLYTADLASDHRWPRFTRRVAEECGVGSLLACRLVRLDGTGEGAGALNLYARRPHAFTPDDEYVGVLLAAQTGVLVDAARTQADLRRALESRDVIGQAKGILMAERDLTESEAFEHLVEVSQRFNIKLRDLARMLADSGSRSGFLHEAGDDG